MLDETIRSLDGLLDERLAARAATPDDRPISELLATEDQAGTLRLSRYNIAPTQPVAVLRSAESGVGLAALRWGFPRLKQATAGASKNRAPHINARAETLANKPTFRDAFRLRRCLILADGFYEWKRSSRQPYFFHPTQSRGFCFAGLWQDGGSALDENASPAACCIVTTEANSVVSPIHHRMPVILERGDLATWLARGITDMEPLAPLLQPNAAPTLAAHPVSGRVNRVAADDGNLLDPVAEAPPEPENLRLF